MYEVQMKIWWPLLGTLIWMIAGMIWYQQWMPTGKKWIAYTGLTEEIVRKEIEEGKRSMPLAFGSIAAAGLVMNLVLLHVVQYGMHATDTWGLMGGLTAAAWCSLGFVMTDVGIYGFEGRSWSMYLVDKGYVILGILGCGAMYGLLVAAPA